MLDKTFDSDDQSTMILKINYKKKQAIVCGLGATLGCTVLYSIIFCFIFRHVNVTSRHGNQNAKMSLGKNKILLILYKVLIAFY